MTDAERKRLADLIARMDSDMVGEREAALGKVYSLCGSTTFFGDLWRQAEAAKTVADALDNAQKDLKAAEEDRDEWIRAHDEEVAANAALARRNGALAALNTSLRAALFLSKSWWRMAAVCTVIAIAYGGWRWSNAEAAPAPPLTAAERNDSAAVDVGLRSVLVQTKWTDGDTPPVAWRLGTNGEHWWVVVRGSKDTDSHTDGRGRPIERHCLQLYAAKAVQDAGSFLTPQPYAAFGLWMRFPLRITECRSPGEKGYS